jgi:peptidoglycan/LPS O-acetylase OafA/YrhL
VLSGFSLAVSPARHGCRFGGTAGFARRRAWRILPAYAAALILSVLVDWMLRAPADTRSVVVRWPFQRRMARMARPAPLRVDSPADV